MEETIRMMSDKVLEHVSGGAYTGSVFVYTVQTGDNLTILAHRFGTTVAVLVELNEIRSPENVHPGAKLLIPLKG